MSLSAIMQENPNAIPEGETPHSVVFYAHDHLVDVAKPGDRIILTGIYKGRIMQANPCMPLLRSISMCYIDAVQISKDERTKRFAERHNYSMATDFSLEKTQLQQDLEEHAFQVSFL